MNIGYARVSTGLQIALKQKSVLLQSLKLKNTISDQPSI